MINTLSGIFKIKVLRKPVPVYCHWEVTFRCNLACRFCTLQSGPNVWQPEMGTEQALDVISQLKKLGTSIIQFVGGEPTLRKDLHELNALARRLGMITAITTNGYILSDDLETIKSMNFIRVSLTGKLNGDHGLSAQSGRLNPVKTLRNLVDMGCCPEIATTISSMTGDKDLDYIFSLARELGIKVGLNFVGVGVSHLNGFCRNDIDLRRKELSNLLIPQKEATVKIRKLYEENKDVVVNNLDFLNMIDQGGLGSFGCRAMDAAICIKADGSVAMPCIEFPMVSEKGELAQVFRSDKAEAIRRRQGDHWFCDHCTLNCMYAASSLLSMGSVVSNAKRYLGQIMDA